MIGKKHLRLFICLKFGDAIYRKLIPQYCWDTLMSMILIDVVSVLFIFSWFPDSGISELDDFGSLPNTVRNSPREKDKNSKERLCAKVSSLDAFNVQPMLSPMKNNSGLKSPGLTSPKRVQKTEEGWKEVTRKWVWDVDCSRWINSLCITLFLRSINVHLCLCTFL